MKKTKKRAPAQVEQNTPSNGVVNTEKAIEMVVPPKQEKPEKPAINKIEESQVTALKGKIQEKAEKADKTNTDAALQKIQYERELKWKYPEGCTSTGDRKVFRQKSRNQIRRWESAALKLDGKAKEAKMAEIQEFRQKVLVDANAAV